VKNVLIQAGIFPEVQDHFGPDHRTIEKLITDKIVASDAVICLIGHVFGTSAGLKDGELRSFTQLEFELAHRLRKPLFLFFASDTFPRAAGFEEPSSFQESQRAHRRAVLDGTPPRFDWFSSAEELERKVYGVLEPVRVGSHKRGLIFEHAPPRPAVFIGRASEIQQLNNAIDARAPCLIAVIGMAGQGKTTLVAHTLRTREHLPFAQGLWVSAYQGGYTFSHFLDTALHYFLGDEFDKAKLPSVDERTRRLIRLLHEHPTVIVIDSIERWLAGWQNGECANPFDQPESRSGAFEGVDDFLKAATGPDNGSHVIITSRALPAVLDQLETAFVPVVADRPLEAVLTGLTPEASVDLLRSLGVVAPVEKLRAVAQQLVYHPFALTSFARLANRLGRHWEDIQALREPSRVVDALLEELSQHIPNPAQSRELLKHAAIFLDDAPIAALAWLSEWTQGGQIQSDAAIAQQAITLADWNVLTWSPDSLTVSLHSLVKQYFERFFTVDELRLTHARIATWYRAQKWNTDSSSLEDARWIFLCIKHALLGGQGERAVAILFDDQGTQSCPYDWLVSRGHLWECVELISEIAAQTTGSIRAHCLLTKFDALQRLDLLSRARCELEEATVWFSAAVDSGDLHAVSGLAKCYGFNGNLSLDTEKAIVARELYDRAITLFDQTQTSNSMNLIDLSRTIANRGLANWSLGNWRSADDDYLRAMDLIKHFREADGFSADPLGFEILIKGCFVHLSADQTSRALDTLLPLGGPLRSRYMARSATWERTFALWLVTMAATQMLAGDLAAARATGSEAIDLLTECDRMGRLGFGGMLAAALVDRAATRFRLGEALGALEDATRAIQLYLEKVNSGASQLEGQLANALLHRARIRIQLGQSEDGLHDLERATVIAERWLRDWFYDCDVGTMVLRHFIALLFSLTLSADWLRKLLETILLIRYKIESAQVETMALRSLTERLRGHWEGLSEAARSLDMAWPAAL
jgi:tetratricopeptide (TPR) repeat protein